MEERLSIQRDFISQDTIDEQRRTREEEWRRAHANADAGPPPEEEVPYDPRSLYEKLQEQKQKKEDAFQEATRLVHRLDDDEIDFLEALHSEEATQERTKRAEENVALDAFRRAQAEVNVAEPPPLALPEPSGLVTRTLLPPAAAAARKNVKNDRQRTLLGQMVVTRRKRPADSSAADGSKAAEPAADDEKAAKVRRTSKDTTSASTATSSTRTTNDAGSIMARKPVSETIKPALAGLVAYSDDSDSDDDAAASTSSSGESNHSACGCASDSQGDAGQYHGSCQCSSGSLSCHTNKFACGVCPKAYSTVYTNAKDNSRSSSSSSSSGGNGISNRRRGDNAYENASDKRRTCLTKRVGTKGTGSRNKIDSKEKKRN
ncbi:N-terminal domain of NEFA-interacting nuclear protein NIP30-domain-containing protein [Thamnocephalis sphaerospora]|uniref:N-terminal domain of NEFA-interacting nuclear protein NIP30-domain-containing protein n=1 Tax=Thamnocephalis sphaerospora TaxID=78915 RepID=A0A4P9XX38_9FUNG|nr:N-terminal domain of NEFA-interacting nuclear protein NIP30-domain-containing protein [Thamnocephalis sphaerospora]|eukprot:RKP10916.1 N-terminal domain of NEFA-interacting nuclear protein NIP30-domain-containing protein [Thamnocephalis sphaerospora]